MTRILMLIGLPGVGKSTWAHANYELDQILSSDAYRERLTGDVNNQSANVDVFETLYADMKRMVYEDKWPTIVFDATNISAKYRKRVFEIGAQVDAAVFVEPLDVILERNRNRERVVSEDVIRKKYRTFHVPLVTEPFNRVRYIGEPYPSRLNEMIGFDQRNPHHSLDLEQHTSAVAGRLERIHKLLSTAAMYHDVGKLDTQTIDDDGIAHYYGHQYVSAQIAIMELRSIVNDYELLYITSLIHYHMDLYNHKSTVDVAKLARRLNHPQLFNDLILLHEADVLSH